MEELEKQVAEKLNMPEEQVHIIIMDLFSGIKFFLYQPHLVKHGIMLNGFLKIKLGFKRIHYYIQNYKANLLKFPRLKWSIQYWEEILMKKDYYGNSERKRKTKESDS